MILLAVLLGVLAVVGLVVAAVAMSRLGDQRTQTAAAEARSTQQASELASTAAALEEAGRAKAAAEEQAAAARSEADLAAAAREVAEERAAAAEQRLAEFAAARAAAGEGGIDPEVLWKLEQARSERTWRQSVAPGPDAVSVFADASDPLLEALQVELDAAREDVGAIVELEVDLPPGMTAAGSVLALRAAQELLAGVVRRGEVTTLHVHADGADLVVAVRSVDEDGEPVPTDPLALPASVDIEPVEDGVRIRDAFRPADSEEPTSEDG